MLQGPEQEGGERRDEKKIKQGEDQEKENEKETETEKKKKKNEKGEKKDGSKNMCV